LKRGNRRSVPRFPLSKNENVPSVHSFRKLKRYFGNQMTFSYSIFHLGGS
jgi:hypothetical protein